MASLTKYGVSYFSKYMFPQTTKQKKDEKKLTKLAELAIGDDQGSESPQPLQCLVPMLLGGVLIDRSIGSTDDGRVELLSLPNKILQQVTVVLAQQEVLGLGDDIANIADQSLALGG